MDRTPPSIRVLAMGDVIGRPGRRALSLLLPKVKEQFHPDVLIINGENAAGGFGITSKIFQQLTQEHGIHVVTTGNHWADKREIHNFISQTPNLLIPGNMFNVSQRTKGYCQLKSAKGIPYAVINLTGRIHMKGDNRCPFKEMDTLLTDIETPIKILDFHAEATSEKQALAFYLMGKVSLVYGTHTHCPTADERILGGHTGFVTDIGMIGGYDSVIGMDKKASLETFLTQVKKSFEPAKNDLWLCAIIADLCSETGRCLHIERIRWKVSEFDELEQT